MSDLSRLLDDVYGTGDAPPDSTPGWLSDAALDEVFGDWVPGEPAEAQAPETQAPEADSGHETATEAIADPELDTTFDDFGLFGTGVEPVALLAEADDFSTATEPEVAEADPVAAFLDSDFFAEADEVVAAVAEADPLTSFLESDFFAEPEMDDEPEPETELFVAEPEIEDVPEAIVDVFDEPEAVLEVVEEPIELNVPVADLGPWQRSDDDILPARRRSMSLSLRRR